VGVFARQNFLHLSFFIFHPSLFTSDNLPESFHFA